MYSKYFFQMTVEVVGTCSKIKKYQKYHKKISLPPCGNTHSVRHIAVKTIVSPKRRQHNCARANRTLRDNSPRVFKAPRALNSNARAELAGQHSLL